MTQATVNNLSIEELRKLIREVVIQTFSELAGDPDGGLELDAEFRYELRQALTTKTIADTLPAHEVAVQLGLNW